MKTQARRLFLLFTLSCTFIFSIAAQTTYLGSVLFPDSLSYPYSITLLDGPTPILTKNFAGEHFSIQASKRITNLAISSLGFESQNISINESSLDTVTLSPIYLEESQLLLNEVVVTAKKAVIRNTGMNYTISNIKGSYIGNAGNLMDMLNWTPGISVTNDESISVLGRGGSPLIYVNGVKIIDQSELHALTASNVDKIEIIREPGAEYPVGTSSVILITTSKSISEMVNGEISENPILRQAFSNKLRASTFGKIKKVSFNASLTYGLNQSKQSSDYILDVFSDTPINAYRQSFAQSSRYKNHSILWFAGANYVTKNKSTFLLQYSGSYGNNHDSFNTFRTITHNYDTQDQQYSTNSGSAPLKHNFLGSASMRVSGGTLKFTATYNHLSNSSTDSYLISNIEQSESSDYDYKYNMVTLQGDYSHSLSSIGKQAFGFYLGYSDNYMHLDNQAGQSSQNVNGDNKWAEAYYSFNIAHKQLSLQGGLRGRYEFDTSTENASERKTLSYTNLAPKFTLSYDFSDNYILSASYAIFYDLPTFRQINPALRLSNLIFYSQGNPDLKKAYTNRFNITANLKNVTIISEFYDSYNSIFNVTEPYNNGTFLRRPENMGRTSDLLLSAEYTVMPISNLRIYSRILGIRSNLKYICNYELIKDTGYTMELDLNAAYRIGKFSLFLNGRYNTPQKVDTRRLSYRLALNVGADCSLMKNKLYIRLEAQDLFNRSVTPSWEEYSPLLYQYRRNKYDTRGLSLTLRYKFTSAKTGFKQASDASDANRLE